MMKVCNLVILASPSKRQSLGKIGRVEIYDKLITNLVTWAVRI